MNLKEAFTYQNFYDRLNVNLAVEITPKYTLDMDLEDCLELFCK